MLPVHPRPGTIELARPVVVRRSRPTLPAVRPKAVATPVLAVLGFMLAAGLTSVGVYLAKGGAAPPIASAAEPSGARPPPAKTATLPLPEPEPLPASSVAPVETTPDASAPPPKARSTGVAPKVKKAGMPLPPAPNF
ncbi:MAG: hypothetical protein ABI193_14285 [Minicystis sp.]